MKRKRLAGFLLSVLMFWLFGTYALAQDGAYVMRVEAPFTNTCPAWLPLRVSVQVKDGKPVAAFATAQQLNATWHEVDLSGLRFGENRFSGTLAVRFRRDDIQQTTAENGLAHSTPNWKYSDVFIGFTSQVLQVSCPVGTLTGEAPGEVSWEKDPLGWPHKGGGTAKARAWRESAANPKQPRHVELYLLRWTDTTKGGAYDGQYGSASVLLRGVLTNNQAVSLIALQGAERYQMQYADLLWRVPEGGLQVSGESFSGTAQLVPNEDLRGKLSQNYHPLPPGPLRVSLQGRIIGNTLAGTAKTQNGDKTVESMVLGQIRTFAHALHADRTPRTWDYTAQPDPALVVAARQEAAIPIRPGEPGKREFWSDWVRFGGYDLFIEDGRRIVQSDAGGGGPISVVSEEEYRAKLRETVYAGIAAPSFYLKAVAGAAKYRYVVRHPKVMHDPVEPFEHSFEAPVPWSSLGPVWDKIPVQLYKHPFSLTVTALDAQGQPIGEPQRVAFSKRASFEGPYHRLPRSYREAALLSARWMRDNPRNVFARLGVGQGVGHSGGDGQLWYTTFSALYAGLALAEIAPDPTERADALEIAVVTADTWLRSMSIGYLPDTYKGWVFDQWVSGTAWLDLYRLTGDERYRTAVLEHARRLVARQMPSGTWPEVEPSGGHANVDPKTGRPFVVSLQGPSMQQWDASSTLYYLGRIRKELKTDEFRAAEDKAYQWVMEVSVARMDWRKQGPGESTAHKMPWPVLPDCALHFFHYLALNLPGRSPDWELMADLLRWSEDRVVDWSRVALISGKPAPEKHPLNVIPHIGYGHNRDVQIRLARAYAILAAHTRNPLHQAKADALVGAMVVAQFPTTGQIPHTPNIDSALHPWPNYAGPGSGDGGFRGEYATMELLGLAQIEDVRSSTARNAQP